MNTYTFEGEQRTVAEIKRMVPCLSDMTIRAHLKAGRNTRVSMLSFDHRAASKAGARKALAARGKPACLTRTRSAL